MSSDRTKKDIKFFPLLRLPAEIRRQIYAEVLGNRLIHLYYHFFECEHLLDTPPRHSRLQRDPRNEHWSLLVCSLNAATSTKNESIEVDNSEDSGDGSDEYEEGGISNGDKDWENRLESRKERRLLGHIKGGWYQCGWVSLKDRSGFGNTCAQTGSELSRRSVYEREMHLCIYAFSVVADKYTEKLRR